MTGPHMLATVAHDGHYDGTMQVMQDLAKVMLQKVGCKHIQVDEPWFSAIDRDEGEAINQAFEGIAGMYSRSIFDRVIIHQRRVRPGGPGSGTVTSTSAATRWA